MDSNDSASENDTPLNDPLVDWEGAMVKVGGNKDALDELVQIFCDEECTRLTQCICAALEREDGAEVARAAHTLKSSADLFGAKRAFEAAQKLESLGARSDIAGAVDCWDTLRQELTTLCAELAKSRN